jgi:hypothetical protein
MSSSSRPLLAVAFVTTLFTGCAVAADHAQDESSAESTAQLAGGCRVVCPKCHPGEVCPMWACMEDCHAADPKSCVENVMCPDGWTWSKHLCSCVGPKSTSTCVETQLCILGDVWDSTSCSCVPG